MTGPDKVKKADEQFPDGAGRVFEFRFSAILIVSCLVYHALFLVAFTNLGSHASLTVLFNADTLFLQDFAQDVLAGYDPRGWMFPIAPFIFPDALISIPAAAIGWSNPPVYLAVYSYLQLGIAMGGVSLIATSLPSMQRMNRRLRCKVSIALGVSMGAFYWLAVLTYCLLKWPFHGVEYCLWLFLLPQSHSGTYAWALCCYGLYFRWRRTKSSEFGIIPLVLALIAGSAGNTLFLTNAILPIVSSLLVAAYLQQDVRRDRWRASWIPLTCVVIAFPVGRFISEIIPHASLSSQSKPSLRAAITALDTYGRGFVSGLNALEPMHWIVTVAFVVLLVWALKISRSLNRRIPANLHLILVFASAGLLTPLVLIAGGSNGLTTLKNYFWTIKYLAPTMLGPFIVIILLASSWSLHRVVKVLAVSRRHGSTIPFAPKFQFLAWLNWQFAVLSSILIVCSWVASMLASEKVGVFGYQPAMVNRLLDEPELKQVNALFVGIWAIAFDSIVFESAIRRTTVQY